LGHFAGIINILNQPWAIPPLAILGFIGLFAVASYISEKRRHTRRLRMFVRTVLIVVVIFVAFLGYRQFNLIRNPPGQILVVVASDPGGRVPTDKELLQKIWEEIHTEMLGLPLTGVKVVLRKIPLRDKAAAESIIDQGAINILIWIQRSLGGDSLHISIAGGNLPPMIGDLFNPERTAKAGMEMPEYIHITSGLEQQDVAQIAEQTTLSVVGFLCYQTGIYSEAVAHFDRALARTPFDVDFPFTHNILYRFLGLAHYQQGHSEEAIDYYQKLVALDRDDPTAHVLLAEAYLDLGTFDKAIAEYETAISLDPTHADAYCGLGGVYFLQDDLENAKTYCQRALDYEPAHVCARVGLSRIYLHDKEHDKAISELQDALKADPQSASLHMNLGMLYEKQGEMIEATKHYQEAVRINPYFAYYRYILGGAYWRLGTQNGLAMARGEFRKAVSLNPCMAPLIHNDLGRAYIRFREKDLAIKEYNMAIECMRQCGQASDISGVYNNRGLAFQKFGDYDKAIEDFTKAIELDPRNNYAFSNRGNAYYELRYYELAISDQNKALEIDPKYPKHYYNRAIAYRELEKYHQAVADFDQAIELDPEYYKALYERGLTYEKLGDNEKAIEDFERILDLGEDEYWCDKAKKVLEDLRKQ
jgi:tetratricopeptide (TPR) repeat protein